MATDTNTRNNTMANGSARIPSALKVSYWNDMVKLEFAPELPESRRTETRRYDWDNVWITCISRAKCNELYAGYEQMILPKIKERQPDSISVPIADVNLLTIGVDVTEDNALHPYVELVKNVDPQTLKSDTTIRYEFNYGEIIHGYIKETGEFKQRILTCNELDTFMKDLNGFREASSKSYVHAARCVDRAYKDNMTNSLRKIGEKVGADLSFTNSYNRDGMGYGSIFDKSNGGNGNAAPTQNYGTLEDLDDALPFN